ncbi:hypothetical protein [uncultured Rikenella sp.]|uniref:hypothetical protein n=1 Tax=uncultured Rikenella sp. TaxID=368003 RepID=UPI0025F25B4C|nr:hypothetical protein [uncultured Rikenella sp.]
MFRSLFGCGATPAPGFRGSTSGALSIVVGSCGHSWASTISSTNGTYLNFDVTHLSPSGADGRAYGFLLRCLSE